MTITLHLRVSTVLYADRTDHQVLDAHSMPSRVVAATPTGPILELMKLTGTTIDVEDGERHTVYAAALELLSEHAPGVAYEYTLLDDPNESVESIPSGSLYIRPPGGGIGFGFPVAWKNRNGKENELVITPPVIAPGQPRIWARYNVILSTEPPEDPTMIPASEVELASATPPEVCRHGRDAMLIEGDVLGWIYDKKFADKPQLPDESRAFRFCRMFPPSKGDSIASGASEGPFTTAAMGEIARLMVDSGDGPGSSIPAGYSFFGQFLTHELTNDRSEGLPLSDVNVSEIEQGRSPAFDLDSLYGRGPEVDDQFFEEDGVRMKIGGTSEVEGPSPLSSFAADLPRESGGTKAVIADLRNDANLPVAQMHLAFLRLHNRIADELQQRDALQGAELFTATRTEMRRSLQAVSLYDFAARITDPKIYSEAISGDGAFSAKHWQISPSESRPGMPVEFSVAAFRLGHSMIGNEYQWNERLAGDGAGGMPTLHDFFGMTGGRGLGGNSALPSDWIIDWRRFFEFGDRINDLHRPDVQTSRKIDPFASLGMHSLPGHLARFGSLPKLNLVRGMRVNLPSGQGLASRMNLDPAQILSIEELSSGEIGARMKELKMVENTPLWLYILREAEIHGGGNHLGAVGSGIVLDTLGVLIAHSEDSILESNDWKPLATGAAKEKLAMADLLAYAGGVNYF